jgi:hypothetical protein
VTKSASGTAALPVNTWTNLAVTYDGANLRMYAQWRADRHNRRHRHGD